MSEPLKQLFGKIAVYEFDLPNDDLDDWADTIDDQFSRGGYAEGYWSDRDAYFKFDGRKGKWFWPLNFGEDENLETFVQHYNDLNRMIANPDLLTNEQCMANCGYHAGLTGFCSVHCNLNPAEYQQSYSDVLRERYKSRIKEMEQFAQHPPVPLSFTHELDEDHVVELRLHEIIDNPELPTIPFQQISAMLQQGQISSFDRNSVITLYPDINQILKFIGKDNLTYRVKAKYNPTTNQILPPN